MSAIINKSVVAPNTVLLKHAEINSNRLKANLLDQRTQMLDASLQEKETTGQPILVSSSKEGTAPTSQPTANSSTSVIERLRDIDVGHRSKDLPLPATREREYPSDRYGSGYARSLRGRPDSVNPTARVGTVWRQPRQALPPGKSLASNFSFYNSGSFRSTDVLHDTKEFEAGVIFSSRYHEPDDRTKDRLEKGSHISQTQMGAVCTKRRKFVCLASFHDHVLALPIYTHNDTGLANKGFKDEFVSIRDSDLAATAAKAETRHSILWAERFTDYTNNDFAKMKDTCAVHFTRIYSHKHRYIRSTIYGSLLPESTNSLKRLILETLQKSIDLDDATPKTTLPVPVPIPAAVPVPAVIPVPALVPAPVPQNPAWWRKT